MRKYVAVTCRKVAVIQEVHGVAASGHIWLFTLGKATDFARGRCKPEFAILAQFELGILMAVPVLGSTTVLAVQKAWAGMEECLRGSGVGSG